MKIEFLDTEKGESIIEDLNATGWRILKEYPLVFDKGIDYDYCVLEKAGKRLRIEWTNWFEWEVTGDATSLIELSSKYQLEITEKR